MKKTLIIILAIIVTVSSIIFSVRIDVKPGGGMVSVTLSNKVYAQDELGGDYDIVFNPTGTHFSKEILVGDPSHLETKGQLKIRLDFYPKEGTKAFEQQYVYMPVEPIPAYPGKVDAEGNPIDLKEYELWYDSLPKEWRLNPALCLFVKIDSLTTVADLESYISNTFTPEMISTIDDIIILEDSAHLITPLLKDKTTITSAISIGDKENIIDDTNTKFEDFFVSGEGNVSPLIVLHESLDVGIDATDRASAVLINSDSYINKDNPVNDDGVIESVEIWLNAGTTTVTYVGMVTMDGNDATTRDYEDVGAVASGSKQTFNGLDIDCVSGDYIGISGDSPGSIERDFATGDGYWYNLEVELTNLSSTAMTFSSPRCISLYGTGTESAGNNPPTVTSVSSASVEETTANLTGNITATGGENPDTRGFQWGTSTGVYTTNQTESGNFSTGSYWLTVTSLPPGDEIYWRATANNSEGYGYGAEMYLETKPEAPTGLSDTDQTDTSIYLEWTKGAGSENTTIRYRTDAYPTDYNDGTLGYNGTDAVANVTGLSPGQIYYFRAWAISTDNTTIYSDDYVQDTGYTLPADPTNLTLSNQDCESMDAEWTKGTGGDKSMVRWKEGGYPADETDGTQAYFDTSNSTTITGLTDDTTIYVSVFAYDSDSGYYSSGSSDDNLATDASSDPTFTTSNATLITNTTARLNGTISGLDCDDADDTFWEWGLSTGNYTSNYTDTTDYGNEAVYHDISSLSANTTYYFRGAARLNSGAWQYGIEFSFTTTSVTGCENPSGLTVTAMTDSHISVEWDTVANATSYLLLVSNTVYPGDPEGSYAVAYNGTSTSATLAGYNLDFNKYYFSLWTHCNPYSDEYDTASIGGESMDVLSLSFQNFAILIVSMIPLIFFSVMAFWKENSVMFMLAAGVSILVGFNFFDVEDSAWALGVSLVLWAYSIACLVFGFMCIFKRSPAD